ncbi:ABC transporter permease [Chthonobacter albigriseus]|uniref:ABC transporter permease n=1 Tax=Chthonobacter albigriseus TaxID=1683161 RepID=UPI0015EE82C4|nr:ABC transporter permease [Chthonobacter albigriseus]
MQQRIDKLGVVIALTLAGAAFLPLATYRANRIAGGEGKSIAEALPAWAAVALALVLVAAALVALIRSSTGLRLGTSLAGIAALALAVGFSAIYLTPEGDRYARVAPGSGFWLALFGLAIMAADAMVRLRLGPTARIAGVLLFFGALGLLLVSGVWDGLSILKEYSGRADVFWREAGTHMTLAVGSLAAAVAVGLPLGIAADRVDRLRAPVLNVLNIVQTIPSIALFGILIAPLGWLAANVPGAAAIGIRGIGIAPAFVALFLYSLLPMVANTVVGLRGVAREAVEAARGMGMTNAQRLFKVELPLAAPLILTGIRIVLVQNIGLATIAALIGGGGFGVFVFQGIGQTATDLILLGAVPTVLLAFAAAVVLDAVVELTAKGAP